MLHFTLKTRATRAVFAALVVVTVGLVTSSLFPTAALAVPVQSHYNHFLSTHAGTDDQFDDNNPDSASNAASQAMNDNQAYPSTSVGYGQVVNAANAFDAASGQEDGQAWQQVGPLQNTVASQVTYTGRQTTNSGRVTVIAVG